MITNKEKLKQLLNRYKDQIDNIKYIFDRAYIEGVSIFELQTLFTKANIDWEKWFSKHKTGIKDNLNKLTIDNFKDIFWHVFPSSSFATYTNKNGEKFIETNLWKRWSSNPITYMSKEQCVRFVYDKLLTDILAGETELYNKLFFEYKIDLFNDPIIQKIYKGELNNWNLKFPYWSNKEDIDGE